MVKSLKRKAEEKSDQEDLPPMSRFSDDPAPKKVNFCELKFHACLLFIIKVESDKLKF